MSVNLHATAFYGILDTGYVSLDQWTHKYDALVAGGAGIIQIRAKRETTSQRAALLDQIVAHRTTNTETQHPPLVVNDDIDLCLAYPDLGLHVGQDDLPAAEARERLGPDRILGLSSHSPEQVLAAIALPDGILDYFAVGPVFATRTKPDYTPVGLKLIEFVAQQNPSLPYFCIGGINRGNISQVRSAGAKHIVTVSDVLCDDNTAEAVAQSIAAIK